jgi:alpha-glucuronidase
MTSTGFDYHGFQQQLVKDKVQAEISFFAETPYVKISPFSDHILYLSNRIGLNRYDRKDKIIKDIKGNDLVLKKMNFDEHRQKMTTLVFQKDWAKLKPVHRELKIKEYCDKLKYSKKIEVEKVNKNRERIYKKLLDGLANKKFVKGKNEIAYDKITMKITDISCLVKKDSGLYKVKFD